MGARAGHDGLTVWVSLGLLLVVVVVVSLLGDPESLAVADLDEAGLRMRARWHAAVARVSWIAVAAGVVMIGRAMAQMPGFTPPKDPKLRVPVEGYELISVILLLTGVVGRLRARAGQLAHRGDDAQDDARG